MSIFEGVEWGSVGQWVGATATFFASFIALRTSNNAQKSFMLDKRPYLTIENIQCELIPTNSYDEFLYRNEIIKDPEGIFFDFSFKNVGKTIANYEVKKMVWNIEETEFKVDENNYKKAGRILPNLTDASYSPFIFCKSAPIFIGSVDFTIVYYREENEEKYEWTAKVLFQKEQKENNKEKLKFRFKEDKERIIPPTGINKIRMILGL